MSIAVNLKDGHGPNNEMYHQLQPKKKVNAVAISHCHHCVHTIIQSHVSSIG